MSSARTRADVRGRRRLPCKVSFGQHPVIRRKRVCGSGGCNFVWNAWAHSNIKKATTIFHQQEILNIIYIWQIYSKKRNSYNRQFTAISTYWYRSGTLLLLQAATARQYTAQEYEALKGELRRKQLSFKSVLCRPQSAFAWSGS